ncbi:MAG: hypothetical protein PHQ75_14925 [Thermoguttaceae bacterium]|nr:hypothetical protein [Thermoguttaceae bacterium]
MRCRHANSVFTFREEGRFYIAWSDFTRTLRKTNKWFPCSNQGLAPSGRSLTLPSHLPVSSGIITNPDNLSFY